MPFDIDDPQAALIHANPTDPIDVGEHGYADDMLVCASVGGRVEFATHANGTGTWQAFELSAADAARYRVGTKVTFHYRKDKEIGFGTLIAIRLVAGGKIRAPRPVSQLKHWCSDAPRGFSMPKYEFRFISAYLGQIDYEVFGDGPSYRVSVRREASAYERSIFNGGDAEWQRDVVDAIGLIHKRASYEPISGAVVEAFNAWRQGEHDAFVAKLKASPEKYGDIPETDPLLKAPIAVTGAHYVVDTGWVRA